MKLSVIIPAHNEEELIANTIDQLGNTLTQASIEHEIVVCLDHCGDHTEREVLAAQTRHSVLLVKNNARGGYGNAVKCGLEVASGECLAIFMADLSDDPADLVHFYHVMILENVDCVFGSRFIPGGKVHDYPKVKYVLNRMANLLVKWIFNIRYNDCTNAFKLYHRNTIAGIQPLLSPHFNLTLEMPLKAIVRGYSYRVIPNSWRNRTAGVSKLQLKEMGSRYFFIFLYCLIEKYFSKRDFAKPETKIKIDDQQEVTSETTVR